MLEHWENLPDPARKLLAGVAVKAFAGLAARFTSQDQPGRVLAPFYRRWRDGLLQSAATDELAAAFEEFFANHHTRQQLDLLLAGQYARVEFDVLEDAFAESCQHANCPLPDADLGPMLEELLLALHELHPQQHLLDSIDGLRSREPAQRNHSLARRAYYRYVLREFEQKPLRGLPEISKQTHVPLQSIYVTPRLATDGREEPFPADELLTGSARRVVILGGPGSGKTTLLQRLALTLAAPGEVVLPVFYRALDYDRDLQQGGDFWDCFHRYLARGGQLRLPFGFFQQQRQTGLAIFLDGLDEVPTARRAEILTAVSHLAESLLSPGRLLITSRPSEYALTPLSGDRYLHCRLQDFNDDEIQICIANWQRLHQTSADARQQAVVDLWVQVESDSGLRELAGNPLMLTLIVLVHWNRGQLPNSRLRLYEACAECLLDRWDAVRGLKSPGLSPDQKREFLGRVAYGLQSAAEAPHPEERGFSLRISRTQLTKDLAKFLHTNGGDTELATELVERFVQRDAMLAKFDEQFGEVQLGFFHRQFQEYFAAFYIKESSDSPADEIDAHLDDSSWQETLRMAVAILPDRERKPILKKLLRQSRAEFALASVTFRMAGTLSEGTWLERLVRFLAKYTWAGQTAAGMLAADCQGGEGDAETREIVTAIFADRRDARVLAAALELAEAYGMSHLVESFFAEHQGKVKADWVAIPAGEFIYGEKRREQRLTLPAFEIDRYSVTNLDFEQMAPGHRALRDQFSDQDDQPVIYVNWYEARLYARWRGARLPDEREWERAARGTNGRVYPWGNEFDAARCNTSESKIGKTTPVGRYQQGDGPQDLAGNVWEWTESWYDDNQDWKVLRGGSWFFNHDYARSACRFIDPPGVRDRIIGFRCARTP